MQTEDFFSDFEPYNFPLYGYVQLPEICLTQAKKDDFGAPADVSNMEFLKIMARKGFEKYKTFPNKDAYVARAKQELATIEKLHFEDYYLLIWRIMAIAKRKKIATDSGRGSCPGSLIFNLIGVSNVDPIKYGLFFERFISEARAKMKIIDGKVYVDGSLCPDVDLDFDKDRKGELVAELETLYSGKICRIATLNTFSSKMLLKCMSKVVGDYKEEDAKAVSDMIPKIFGAVRDIEECYEGVKDKDSGAVKEPPIDRFVDWVNQNKEIYEISLGLRDLPRNKGKHPAGYIVSRNELGTFMPVGYVKPSKEELEARNEEGLDGDDALEICAALPMEDVSNMTVKVDLLSARCCTVVDEVLKNNGLNAEDVNPEDPIIYSVLQDLDAPYGLFQIEAGLNLRVTKDTKPTSLAKLGDAIALARPGAMAYVPQYLKGEPSNIYPPFDKILDETRGVCIYQETVMALVKALGFSLLDAEDVRRCVSKKNKEKMHEWKAKIYAKCEETEIDKSVGDSLWGILEANASYGFNRCVRLTELVETAEGHKQLKDVAKGEQILAYDTTLQRNHYVEVVDIHHSETEIFEIEFASGKKIATSLNHKFLCEDGQMRALRDILLGDFAVREGADSFCKIKSIASLGLNPTIDLEVNHPDHNFYCNGLVVSNSHAMAFASQTAITVYLKYKFPTDYYIALLNHPKVKSEWRNEIFQVISELHRFGIKMLPPSIKHSKADFTKDGGNIRFGLGAIKGLGAAAVKNLEDFNVGNNRFELFEGAFNAGLDIRAVAALVQCGTFDEGSTESRASLTLQAQLWRILSDKEKVAALKDGARFGYNLFKTFAHLRTLEVELKSGAKKPFLPASRLATIEKKFLPFREIYLKNKDNQALADYFYERTLLGASLSQSMRDIYQPNCEVELNTVAEMLELKENTQVAFVAMVEKEPEIRKSKKNADFGSFEIADETGTIKCLCFSSGAENVLERIKGENSGALPGKDSIVYCRGVMKKDAVFLSSMKNQNNKIHTAFKIGSDEENL